MYRNEIPIPVVHSIELKMQEAVDEVSSTAYRPLLYKSGRKIKTHFLTEHNYMTQYILLLMSPKQSTGRGPRGGPKRQKVDDNESLQSLFDKARRLKNINLIEEEFDKTEDKNEISFKKIKEKLQSWEYSNKQGLVTDLSKVAARAKKSFISWQIFDAASELESFVDKQAETFTTKVNLPHHQNIQSEKFASVLLQLNLDEKARSIRLEANRSLNREQGTIFSQRIDNFQQTSLLLSWPLPGLSGPKEPMGANLSQKFSTHRKTFNIQNSIFKVGYLSLSLLLPININITETNQIDGDKFTDMYVKPFLEEGYLKEDNFKKLHDVPYFSNQTQQFKDCLTEHGVERQLLKCVYDVLEPFILKSLEDKKKTISGQMKDIIDKRSYITTTKYSDLQLESLFTNLKYEIPFLGTKTIPDLQIGYFTNSTVVFLSGMGEVEYISLDLKSNVEKLIKLSKTNTGRILRSGPRPLKSNLKLPRGRLKTLIETTAKSASILGATRFVLTDFKSFLFVKLKVGEEADLQSVKGINAGDEKLKKRRHIKATYSCFSLLEPGIRLKFLSFFWLDDSYLKELAEFRDNVSQMAEEIIAEAEEAQRKLMENDAKGRSANGKSRSAAGRSTDTKQAELNPEIFRYPALVTLGDKVIKQVVNITIQSKVVLVDVASFKEQVPPDNFITEEFPADLILKVYDPINGDLLHCNETMDTDLSNYSYQDSIDFTSNEVQCLLILQNRCHAKFSPRLFAYGRLADTFHKVGEPYLRLVGGYILIEKLETDDTSEVITRKYFEEKIVKTFEQLHACGIVHNDIRQENCVFQKDAFKLIDFGHSIFNATENQKEFEMDWLHRYFGFHR